MNFIKTYRKNTVEYKKLDLFKHMIEVLIFIFDLPIVVKVEDVYFDIGQNWWWTSLVIYEKPKKSKSFGYHLLNPKQFENIILGNAECIKNIYDEIKEKLLEKYYLNVIETNNEDEYISFGVMLDLIKKETFVERFNKISDFDKMMSEDCDQRHCTSAFDNQTDAIREARRVAKISTGYSYNKSRNKLL